MGSGGLGGPRLTERKGSRRIDKGTSGGVGMSRVFSGIQPTGVVHIGNYVGAIRNWVRLQDEMESFYCIVDYHSMTIPYDAESFPRLVLEAAVVNLAAEFVSEKTRLLLQCHVPDVSQIVWMLWCVTPLGQLQGMTQFKLKVRSHAQTINVGLLN